MDIKLTCRHCSAEEDVKDYATKKLEHVLRHFDGVHSVEVVFSEEGTSTGVEVIIGTVRSQRLVAEAKAGDAMSAIDLAMDKMDRQIKKLKEKLREQR